MFPAAFQTLLSTITPAKGLALLTHHLSENLKFEVKKYDLLFDVSGDSVDFTIYDERFEGGTKKLPYKGGQKFLKVAMHYLSGKIPEGAVVDKALLNYSPEGINAYLFYSQDGKKQAPIHYKF